ncbi:hypothetical protein PHYBLDRAFT_67064 [Phycomyces blakesleeanus NRRL 1555(-)]|uniref:Uncharacterized protein n=1 Tax=Phycomyces blakesleeanus (strain ATCC 8743b / DSM 1359 / FGSC 10004 / NBRC 33097 / NRRL 1555) TaxID=763407 RepID=A0A162WM05_PHYB8|nr:hypothetical protein PHYBLDRAFT_67064 [Phycomyces blakesleeanus NRRL 1555(-)]OAD68965.1 hypothetical protein PHYBLDRAFT_67064 [Phycomyces blakesleeanus NRRL 1555(-)]|eukprot:XP_018287005.1 hypothetical protein PHYBLDRAFT_67064 [Phycomyces blakesleeanus NRRL 1555(-)]
MTLLRKNKGYEEQDQLCCYTILLIPLQRLVYEHHFFNQVNLLLCKLISSMSVYHTDIQILRRISICTYENYNWSLSLEMWLLRNKNNRIKDNPTLEALILDNNSTNTQLRIHRQYSFYKSIMWISDLQLKKRVSFVNARHYRPCCSGNNPGTNFCTHTKGRPIKSILCIKNKCSWVQKLGFT